MFPSRTRRNSLLDKPQQRRHRPDYILLMLSIILLVIGLVVVYAISPGLSAQKGTPENYFITKQLIAIALGVVGFFVISNLPVKSWRHFERPLMLAAAISAMAVIFFGEEVNGAQRWIQVGGISFQPAELIKFVLIIWAAGFLSNRLREGQLDNFNNTLKPLGIVLAVVTGVVAILQRDLGSTVVMAVIMAAMVFVVGLPLKRIVPIGLVLLVGAAILIGSSGYRRDRLTTFLNPERDCIGSGYQSCQALIAVGSGGVLGLGLGKGVQAFGYLPEAANDSIFAIYSEKFGFAGTSFLLLLFAVLFTRLKKIITHAPDDYSKLLATGILAWLSTQTIINVGAMIGLLPVKGITLPFISYGGTSVVFVMGAIGLAFQLSRYTTYSINTNINKPEGKSYDNSVDRRGFRGAYHPNLGGR